MPETAYYGPRPSIDIMPRESQETEIASKTEHTTAKGEQDAKTVSGSSDTEALAIDEMPKSYLGTLKCWSRDAVNPHIRVKVAFLRPLVLLA